MATSTSKAGQRTTTKGSTGRKRKARARRTRWLVPAALAVAVAVVAGLGIGTMAQGNSGSNNQGTIKVHDGSGADPDERNEPHVMGDAWVEGFNMLATGGSLQIFTWPPTGDRTLVVDTTWEADDGEPEHHFLAGPFVLECGHYRVEAENGDEPNDFPGGPKVKMFWVDCEETPPTSTTTSTTSTTSSSSSTSQTETTTSTTTTTTAPPSPSCPADLSVTSNDDGTVLLEWTPAAGSDGTNIYRADGAGDFVYLATAGAGVSSWTDLTAEAAGEYAYTVTGLFGNEESTDCPVVERSAIPDFPTIVGLGLASAGGLAAILMRRRLA